MAMLAAHRERIEERVARGHRVRAVDGGVAAAGRFDDPCRRLEGRADRARSSRGSSARRGRTRGSGIAWPSGVSSASSRRDAMLAGCSVRRPGHAGPRRRPVSAEVDISNEPKRRKHRFLISPRPDQHRRDTTEARVNRLRFRCSEWASAGDGWAALCAPVAAARTPFPGRSCNAEQGMTLTMANIFMICTPVLD